MHIAINNNSGIAGIAHWINAYFHLSKEEEMSKQHPVVLSVKKWVDAQYEEGRVTTITDKELEKVTLKAMKNIKDSSFD